MACTIAVARRGQHRTLSHAARRWYYSLKIKLRHSIAEECGQIPNRVSVEVDSGLALQSVVEGWDRDRWMANATVERGWVPPSSEALTVRMTAVPLLLSRSVSPPRNRSVRLPLNLIGPRLNQSAV
jgi:hypothetical protein